MPVIWIQIQCPIFYYTATFPSIVTVLFNNIKGIDEYKLKYMTNWIWFYCVEMDNLILLHNERFRWPLLNFVWIVRSLTCPCLHPKNNFKLYFWLDTFLYFGYAACILRNLLRILHLDNPLLFCYFYIFYSTLNNNWSTVIDHYKSLCDHRKALLIGHHDCHYLDIATTFINLIPLQNLLTQPLP